MSSATPHFRLAFLGILISFGSLSVLGQTAEFEKSFHQGTEAMKAGHWDDASAACTLVLAALRGEGSLAEAASAAEYAASAWESEAIAGNREKQAAPHDVTWAIKCAADTACWVTDAILNDASLIAYAAESAVASGGSCRFLIKRLSSLIGTEFAATRGWNPPLSFS